jgi:CO/xanthine dehydrogenase FAD-binding subunit
VTDSWAPRSLPEALALRAAHPEATVVAGGTDLMVGVNFGRTFPTGLLDLSHVEELTVWERDDGRVRVGSGVTFARIAAELDDLTALAEAAATVGSAQVRNRATLGGNIVTASPAGDGIAALAAYDAEIVVAANGREQRRIPWNEFFLGPKQTALAGNELVVGAEWNVVNGPGTFAKLGPRSAMVIAVASVCVQLDEDAHDVRIALGSVGPTVLRATRAEQLCTQLDWDLPEERALEQAGALAAADAQPIDDLRGSAAYRRHAIQVLVRRALGWTLADRRRVAA